MGKYLGAIGVVLVLSGFVVMIVGSINLLDKNFPWLIENAEFITLAGIIALGIGGGLMAISEKIGLKTKPVDTL